MKELERVKEKIKKLFALTKSSNANEASVALEMAQKLMAAYGIERNAVGEIEGRETGAPLLESVCMR